MRRITKYQGYYIITITGIFQTWYDVEDNDGNILTTEVTVEEATEYIENLNDELRGDNCEVC